MKRCLNIQEECLGYEAVRAEAESEDKDRPRIIVNPDFVENQDRSDGAEQYDPEEMKAFQKWLDSEGREKGAEGTNCQEYWMIM